MRYSYLRIQIDLPTGKNIDSIRTHVIFRNSRVAEQKGENAKPVSSRWMRLSAQLLFLCCRVN